MIFELFIVKTQSKYLLYENSLLTEYSNDPYTTLCPKILPTIK